MDVIFFYIFILLQINSDRIVNIKIDPGKDKDTNFLLSEIAKEVKYIKLETKDNCMISMIIKLLADENYVFIASHQGTVSRLFVFTAEGKFINEIGSPGRGPGEFSTVLDFTLNKSKKEVYILDTMGKILLYDYSGKYLNTIKLDTRPTSLLYSQEALYLFTAWPDYYLNKGYGIQIKHLSKNREDTYLLNRQEIIFPKQSGIMVDHNYFYGINSEKTISFLEAKFDTLYHIDSNDLIKPIIVFNLINKMPRNLLTLDSYLNARRTHNSGFRFIIVNNFIFFSVITADQTTYLYRLNTTSEELLKHNVTKDKNYIINDFDGGLSFKPVGLADQGILYSTLDCDALKDHFGNSNQKRRIVNPTLVNDLKKIVQNSEYSDNPIIMLVTVK